MMSITTGNNAPEIKLFNTTKQEITLIGLKGKNVVLLFFPLAFTGTCTTELCNIRDNYNIYEGLNAVVLGISVDSLFSLGKFKEEQKLNFDLLSDFNREASTAYGCLYNEFVFGMKGVSKRSAFVVDKNGVIQYAEVLEKAGDLPDFEKIQACLKSLH
jgi:glutaredoxin-dependent peroxiredoxin